MTPNAGQEGDLRSLAEDDAGKLRHHELMASELICSRFTSITFADSHGVSGRYLGTGYLYYAFAATLRSQVSVCIGSGGGFVPDLLAQAQRDLGLRPSATYLIDANLPELGFGSPGQPGGWLSPESDFLVRAADVVVLRMLSSDAAKLFARERIQIDYLHIDGDHSTRGVLADFEDFAGLLSSDGVISFHEAKITCVRDALERIRREHRGWEYLAFAEIGTGSAFMRRVNEEGMPKRPQASERLADPERRTRINPVELAAAGEASANRARYERWHYLATPTYRSRYHVIAPEIDHSGGTVIEIGGFPNSVVDVLTRTARVIAVEPYAPDVYVAQIEKHAQQKGIEYVLRQGSLATADLLSEIAGDYVLVYLGLDISAGCETVAEFEANLTALLQVVRRAAIVAVEFPEYEPSLVTWALLASCLQPTIIRDMRLDLSNDPVAESYYVKDKRAQRRIIVFRSTNDDSPVLLNEIKRCASQLSSLKSTIQTPRYSYKDGKFLFLANNLQSKRLEQIVGPSGEISLDPDKDVAGNVTYGPYLPLRPGSYRATVNYDSPAEEDITIGRCDVCINTGREMLIMLPMMGTGGAIRPCILEFSLTEEQHVEVRVFFDGVAAMCFRDLVIEPCPLK